MPKYKKQKYMSWKRYYERKYGKGIASNYIQLANIKKGDRVVIVARVSCRTQEREANLQNQVDALRKYVESHGGIVIAVIMKPISGFDPYWLRPAAKIARKHDAIILAETTNRLIRNNYFDTKRVPNVQAKTSELEELKEATFGVVLATKLHPDAPPCEERSIQAIRGQTEKERKGGRPMKPKRRRELNKPKAILLREEGKSYGEIKNILKVSRSTLQYWLKDVCKGVRT